MWIILHFKPTVLWYNKTSGEVLNKLKSKHFLASSVSTFDGSSLNTTLPHNLILEKLTQLNEHTFNRDGSLYFLICL